jgi:hypothetical protein
MSAAKHVAVAVAIVAAPAALVVAWRIGGDWKLLHESRTVEHGQAVADVLAVRELCGADVTLTWDLADSTGLDPLPELLAGRTVSGTVTAGAVACSVGVPAVDVTADRVTVTVTEPRIVRSWIDVEATTAPAQSRGLLDRLVDTVDCAIGSCTGPGDAVDRWLDEAAEEAARLAAEGDAVEVAAAEVTALVEQLVGEATGLPVTVRVGEVAR